MKNTAIEAPATADFNVLAQKLVEQVRSLAAQIPGFTLPHPSQPELRGPASNVPPAAVDACLSAAVAHKALAESIDVAEVAADEQFVKYFADLRDEVKILFTGLDYTIRRKRYDVGQATLSVLNIARQLSRKPENAHLNPHIEAIEKALHRRRRNSKTPEPPPPPASA